KASYAVKKGNAAAERVIEILETENTIADPVQPKNLSDLKEKITFDNISFKYEEDFVLKNFNLEVPKGHTVAIVGQSGSGKSTLANLLTRFYDVNEGKICIDHIDIRHTTQKALRDLMGLVTQDSILFNDSIKGNLLVADENATDEEIIHALKIANAWEFIETMPNG